MLWHDEQSEMSCAVNWNWCVLADCWGWVVNFPTVCGEVCCRWVHWQQGIGRVGSQGSYLTAREPPWEQNGLPFWLSIWKNIYHIVFAFTIFKLSSVCEFLFLERFCPNLYFRYKILKYWCQFCINTFKYWLKHKFSSNFDKISPLRPICPNLRFWIKYRKICPCQICIQYLPNFLSVSSQVILVKFYIWGQFSQK